MYFSYEVLIKPDHDTAAFRSRSPSVDSKDHDKAWRPEVPPFPRNATVQRFDVRAKTGGFALSCDICKR